MRATSFRFARLAISLTISVWLVPTLSGESAYFNIATRSYVEDLHRLISSVSESENYESVLPELPNASGFLKQLASDCDQYGVDCATANRLAVGVSGHDLLSTALNKHLGRALDFSVVRPSDADSDYLPKPYPYMNLTKAARYLADRLTPGSSPEFLTYTAPPPPTRELSYTPGPTPSIQFDSSALAGALTDFLINRASQELLHSISRGIQEDHSASTLIPAMAAFLSNPAGIQISAIVPAFRSAAADDIQRLPSRLRRYAADHVGDGFRRAHVTLDLIRSGMRPAIAFARFVNDPLVSQHQALGPCNPLDVVARFAHESNVSRLPAGKSTVGGYTRLGLHEQLRADHRDNSHNSGLYDEYIEMLFGDHHKACLHSARGNDEFDILSFSDSVFLRLDQINKLIADFSELPILSQVDRPESAASGVLVSRVVQMTIDLIEFVADELAVVMQSTQNTKDGSKEVGNNVEVLRFNAALVLWMEMYRSAHDQRYTDTASFALRYIHRLSLFEQDGELAGVVKLINLGANLIEAQTADEFKSVLYAATEPVGSYVAKRRTGSRVTLGAYVGAIAGGERIQGPGVDSWQGHAGVALPVGIEFSWGYSHGKDETEEENCCAFGIFVSPLDFGLVANYRVESLFSGSENVEPAQVGWQQIFAPSVFFVLGVFEDVPLVVAGGLQYAPQARLHPDTDNSVDALRISLMVAIDVTLLQL